MKKGEYMRDVTELSKLTPETGETVTDFRRRNELLPQEFEIWRTTEVGRNTTFPAEQSAGGGPHA